jgi:hypothetical protein
MCNKVLGCAWFSPHGISSHSRKSMFEIGCCRATYKRLCSLLTRAMWPGSSTKSEQLQIIDSH